METILLAGPVTALEFVGEDILLSGEGPYLTVNQLDSPACHVSRRVLARHHIHGIRLAPQQVLAPVKTELAVFGGKELQVLELRSYQEERSVLQDLSPLRELKDWIWDVCWLKHFLPNTSTCQGLLAVALAHNSVLLIDPVAGREIQEVHCEEKCILYSALFVGHEWDHLVLVSGTVFNQLILWRPGNCGLKNEEGRARAEKRIEGHHGVIFGLAYQSDCGFLASASDDRSVRLWKVGDLTVDETFWKPSIESCYQPMCLHILYGHQARVWAIRFLADKLLSIGEDGACLLWDCHHGKVLQKLEGHRGKGIRALAVRQALEGVHWVATGGADGGIRQWRIDREEKDHVEVETKDKWLIRLQFDGHGSPKIVRLADRGRQMLVMTDMGSIYSSILGAPGEVNSWQLLTEDPDFQSYSILELSSNLDMSGASHMQAEYCAVGSICGRVKVFSLSHPDVVEELKKAKGKIHNLCWGPCLDHSRMLFVSASDGQVYCWQVLDTLKNTPLKVFQCGILLLPSCRQRWLTGVRYLPERNMWVCGDRRGSVLLYNDMRNDAVLGTFEAISFLFGLHGKQGVTSVEVWDGQVYSSGRDGCFRILSVRDMPEGGPIFEVLRVLRLGPSMEWIERLLFQAPGLEWGKGPLVMGFHSTDFILWDFVAKETLLTVPCGGGHRSWTYSCSMASGSLVQDSFAYIKQGAVYMYHGTRFNPGSSHQAVTKAGLHGSKITCLCHLGCVAAAGEAVDILVTSSEDTTISVLSLQPSRGQISPLASLTDHISSVRALAKIHPGKTVPANQHPETLSSLFVSAGGRAELHSYRVTIGWDGRRKALTCQVVHLAMHRLDEHWDRKKNRHKTIKMDPETRYMCLAVVEAGDCKGDGVIVVAACSDGAVRAFSLQEEQRRLVLLWESFYHQRCVLCVAVFSQCWDTHCRQMFLCSGATDGNIAIWDISESATKEENEDSSAPQWLTPSLLVSAHQCGVNCLDVGETEVPGQYLVLSGSDDNSLHVCLVDISNRMAPLQLLRTFSVVSAHAAPITGARWLTPHFLVSASVDQRVVLWSVREASLSWQEACLSHVADVSSLEIWQKEDGDKTVLSVCGQGLQVLQLGSILQDISCLKS
uniref:tRNA (34-2'-O)-methyltransferase regulator WDR6 n=1 Tax=Erpetoichthys calabaricus TaxID=27687 RepID=A0A8C4TKY3_ERPCA